MGFAILPHGRLEPAAISPRQLLLSWIPNPEPCLPE